MRAWLSFFIYRYLLIPFLVQVLHLIRPFMKGKIRNMIEERWQFNWPEVSARPIWIHAASGEIEYAKPVIREIKKMWPQKPILVTYFSPSAKKLIKNVSGVEVLVALPWDHKKLIKRFLNHFKPEILLIARTDAWPEVLYQTKKQHIPSLLFSATFSKTSRRKGFLASSLTCFALNQLSEIHCVSNDDSNEIKKLGVTTKIEITGDTRYDQVVWRLANPNPIHQELQPKNKMILVAGSTWPEDEKVLIPGLRDFIKQGGLFILAPHEVAETRIQKLSLELSSYGYSWIRYSRATHWDNEQILILDQIGVLQEIYTWGDFAFVGGSFKDRVHSVMEPLAAGLPVLVGPFHKNNREALLFQKKYLDGLPAVIEVKSASDVQKWIQNLVDLKLKNPKIKDNLQKLILENTGATNAVLGHIRKNIDSV